MKTSYLLLSGEGMQLTDHTYLINLLSGDSEINRGDVHGQGTFPVLGLGHSSYIGNYKKTLWNSTF
jgi:hypothetical protein